MSAGTITAAQLLAGDADALTRLRREWERTGWCLVDLSATAPPLKPPTDKQTTDTDKTDKDATDKDATEQDLEVKADEEIEASGFKEEKAREEAAAEKEQEGEEEHNTLVQQARKMTAQSAAQFAAWIVEPRRTAGAAMNSRPAPTLRSKVSPVLGHVVAPHKESLRFLSGGEELAHFGAQLPPQLAGLVPACQAFQQLMDKLTEQLCGPVFQQESVAALQKVAGLTEGYGMVDYAYYFNDDASHPRSAFLTTEGLNCVDHYDPGLFTLSLLSSAPGLQMWDYDSSSWVDMPVSPLEAEPTLGVLWTGGAAVEVTGGALKPGKHRVAYAAGQPRVAVWHEVSLLSQIVSAEEIEGLDRELLSGSVFIASVGSSGLEIKAHNIRRARDRLQGPATKVDETDSKIISTIEYDRGMSVLKSGRMTRKRKSRLPKVAPHIETVFGVSLADVRDTGPATRP